MSTVWTPHTRIGIMKTIMNHSWIKSLAYKYGKKHTCNCINSNQFQRSKIVKNTPPLESIEKLQRYRMFTKVWKQQENITNGVSILFRFYMGGCHCRGHFLDSFSSERSALTEEERQHPATAFSLLPHPDQVHLGHLAPPWQGAPGSPSSILTRCTWITLLHPDQVHLVLDD